jgi:hypothetical protein
LKTLGTFFYSLNVGDELQTEVALPLLFLLQGQ